MRQQMPYLILIFCFFFTPFRSRSSGQAGSTILPAHNGLDALRVHAANLVNCLLSRNTLKKKHLTIWLGSVFVDSRPSIPAIVLGMSKTWWLWLPFAIANGHFPLTPSSYTSQVFSTLSLQDPDRPSIFEAHPTKAILKGIQKSQGQSRLTITGPMFRGLSDFLSL